MVMVWCAHGILLYPDRTAYGLGLSVDLKGFTSTKVFGISFHIYDGDKAG
jgi:hypothetical protein